jgi:signal transduction histidine kinase
MDRGAEIADALAGHVRTPVFVCEDIARTIERVCKTLEPLARAEGLRILRSGEARPFYHDRTHIFNAVYNLVHNAISHVSAGGTVCVILSEVDSWVEIRVKDDGRGMPERVRTSLFTTKPISTTPGGTGLGTRIVQRVVELHRGSVQVESEPGYGTEVLMRIPMSQPDEHLSENGVKPKA